MCVGRKRKKASVREIKPGQCTVESGTDAMELLFVMCVADTLVLPAYGKKRNVCVEETR